MIGCPDQGREANSDDPQQALYLSLGNDALRCSKDVLQESAFATLNGDWTGSRVTLKKI